MPKLEYYITLFLKIYKEKTESYKQINPYYFLGVSCLYVSLTNL